MKKQLFGALLLVAALVMTGCGNQNQKKENTDKQQVEKVKKENRMLIIVDPQIDFTTGSLATAKGPETMDRLAVAIDNGVLDNYTWVIVTQDAHPANHCSFVENGGVFPPHCVQGTEGMNVYPALQSALDEHMNDLGIHYMLKGDLADKEEFSIFQNAHSGEKLSRTITEFETFVGIDVCGIATDYCVYETVKDLMNIYPAKQIHVVTNCIAAVDDNDTKLADLMKENGIEAITF